MSKKSFMNSKAVKGSSALTLTGLVLASSLTMMPGAQAEPTGSAAATSALAQCGVVNMAQVLDLSNSFTPEEIADAKAQMKASIEQLSGIPGAKVTIFTFGLTSPVNYEKAQSYSEPVPGTLRTLAGNAPSASFDVSTAEGKAAALAWVDGVTKGGTNVPKGEDPAAYDANFQTLGTNWEAALTSVEQYQADTGVKFTHVALITDGAPTAYLDDAGNAVVSGPGNAADFDTATWSSKQAYAEAKVVADRLLASGVDVLPVIVNDPNFEEFGTDRAAMINIGASLSGEANPVEGSDYFNQDMGLLGVALFNAATSTCPTDLKISKTADTETINYDGTASFQLEVLNAGEWDEPKASVLEEGITFVNKATGEKVTSTDVTITKASQGTVNGLNWNIGLLKAGQKVTATATAVVPAEVAAWEDVAIEATNYAHVTGKRDPYDPKVPFQPNGPVEDDTDNRDDASVKVTSKPRPVSDVKIAKKQVTPQNELRPGGPIVWEVEGLNDSDVTDPKVVFEDVLSAEDLAKIQDGTLKLEVITGDGVVSGTTYTDEANGGMTPGETFKLRISGTLTQDVDLAGAGITNKATISGEYDPYDPNGQCEPNNGVVASDTDNCDLVVTKIDSQVKIYKQQVSEKLVAGEQGTWSITVGAFGADDATKVFLAELPLTGIEKDTVEFGKPDRGEIVTGQVLVERGFATAEQVEVDKLYWLIADVLPTGETATVEVTGIVSESATEVTNSAVVTSTWDKYTGGTKDNNSLEEDDDNYDEVSGKVEKPEPPVTPEPSEPPVTPEPSEPAKPSEPASPAPSQPSTPEKPVTVVKGESAKTGSQAEASGINLLAIGGGALALIAVAGGAALVLARRKKTN